MMSTVGDFTQGRTEKMIQAPTKPPWLRCAGAFAAAGLVAGAAHVLWTDADSLRLWREVLPLAGLIGATVGAIFRPAGWRRGALAALLAAPAFALAYAVAEASMMAGRGEVSGLGGWLSGVADWTAIVLARSAAGASVAIAAGAAAGWRLGR